MTEAVPTPQELPEGMPEADSAYPPEAAPHRHIVYPGPIEAFGSLLAILVVALFALTFILQPFRIPSESMERTLLVGDFLLVDKSIYGPPGKPWSWLLPYRQVEQGDIIVFHSVLDPNEHIVKRVIGVPGDRIHLRNGTVYRNGKPIAEPQVVYETSDAEAFRDQFPTAFYTDPRVDPRWWTQMPGHITDGDLIVPANSYFVMGDNRNHSLDSRYWGFVPRSAIVGRPFVIYFSLRQPSTTDLPEMSQVRAQASQSDKLGHNNDAIHTMSGFARWNRILRIVR